MRSKVVILGSGPAGATAAIYAARAMLEPTMIAGVQPGGQLTITTEVENYPGFVEAIQGPWLMEQMQAQAEHVGTNLVQDTIVSADLTKRPFTLVADSGDRYIAETLIIATGASANWLGLPSEEKFKGFGVSACATCDGFFYRGKRVAVVGGGNTAAEEALFLTNFADKVTLIHRRATLRADKTNQMRLARNPKIEIIYGSIVDEVIGTDEPRGVNAIKVRNLSEGTRTTVDVDGLFIAIGHSPATGLFRGQLEMDTDGYIRTAPDSTSTSVPGVFAAGDVRDKVFRQAVTAAGMGCMAALEAERFLAGGTSEARLEARFAQLEALEMSSSATPNQAFLDRLDASRDQDGGLASLVLELQSEQGQREFARKHGLYLPWVPALHLMERHAAGTIVRLAALANPTVDQRSLFHRWIASVWTAESPALQSHVADVELQGRCGAAMSLHADAAAGHVIDRRRWRRARSALSDAMDSSLQGCAVGVVAASCWDPDTVPGVFADIFHAWSRVLHEEVQARKGWDAEANQETQQKERMATYAAGMAAAGPVPENPGPDWKDSDEGQAWVRRYKEAVIAFTTNSPDGMFRWEKAMADAHRRLAIGLADNALSLLTGPAA